ncbi:MAG: hypothetical protein K2U26_13470 [Cyclobacteriaceae bacterium]|nr:hypothetical protein [Cyclobacteriaceae bacterium]
MIKQTRFIDKFLLALFVLIIANRLIGMYQFYLKMNSEHSLYFKITPIVVLIALVWLMVMAIRGSRVQLRFLEVFLILLVIFKLSTTLLVPSLNTLDTVVVLLVAALYAGTAIYIHFKLGKPQS